MLLFRLMENLDFLNLKSYDRLLGPPNNNRVNPNTICAMTFMLNFLAGCYHARGVAVQASVAGILGEDVELPYRSLSGSIKHYL